MFVCMDGVTGVADGLKVIYPKARTFRFGKSLQRR